MRGHGPPQTLMGSWTPRPAAGSRPPRPSRGHGPQARSGDGTEADGAGLGALRVSEKED